MNDGWIGMYRELKFYLHMVDADKDADGNYLITGEPVFFGLGGDECVVSGRVMYLVDGKPKGLAAGLRSTSYGLKVAVIS